MVVGWRLVVGGWLWLVVVRLEVGGGGWRFGGWRLVGGWLWLVVVRLQFFNVGTYESNFNKYLKRTFDIIFFEGSLYARVCLVWAH